MSAARRPAVERLRPLGAGEADPLGAALLIEHPEQASAPGQHRQQAELGERAGVHADGVGEDRVRHAFGVVAALHERAYAGASGLDPTQLRRQVGQRLVVGVVEVEEDVGAREQRAPAGLVRR
jgi:hypothetical protein